MSFIDVYGLFMVRISPASRSQAPMLLHVALLSKSKSAELRDRVRYGKSVSKQMVPVLDVARPLGWQFFDLST